MHQRQQRRVGSLEEGGCKLKVRPGEQPPAGRRQKALIRVGFCQRPPLREWREGQSSDKEGPASARLAEGRW